MYFLENAPEYEQIVETAFVYHDIGLWTDQELACLEPSKAVALQDNDKFGWGLAPDALRGATIGTTRCSGTKEYVRT